MGLRALDVTPPTGTGAPRAVPRPFHLMAKPAGAACNLDCAYCFFLDKAALYPGSALRMSDAALERYTRQLIESHPPGEITVAWQGGEPTLMGLDFYHRAMSLLERYRRPGDHFVHTMQTNGTLLDDEWGAFFKQHGFLVGISIDGPPELHDAYRVDKGAHPTFERVLAGVRVLQAHGVDFNVLTTVNRNNGNHPIEVYRFLRDEVGATWMQFIPVVERADADGCVSRESVLPAQYGAFLCAIFDEWVRRDVGTVFIPTFEATLANWLRLPSSSMCIFDRTCGGALVLEHNGDVYSCDHFVDPTHLLGNIDGAHLVDLVASTRQQAFGRAKLDALPRQCIECDVRFACHGECPKNRFSAAADGAPGLNYLCDGLRAFFHHVADPMNIMAQLLRNGRDGGDVMGILGSTFAPDLRPEGDNAGR